MVGEIFSLFVCLYTKRGRVGEGEMTSAIQSHVAPPFSLADVDGRESGETPSHEVFSALPPGYHATKEICL
jgi:hypothetical protein